MQFYFHFIIFHFCCFEHFQSKQQLKWKRENWTPFKSTPFRLSLPPPPISAHRILLHTPVLQKQIVNYQINNPIGFYSAYFFLISHILAHNVPPQPSIDCINYPYSHFPHTLVTLLLHYYTFSEKPRLRGDSDTLQFYSVQFMRF